MKQLPFDPQLAEQENTFAMPLASQTITKEQLLRNPCLYQEMQMTFRYVQTHSDVNDQADVIPLHSHHFWELLYCFDGSVDYLLGSQRYRIQPGDVIVIPPNTGHYPLFSEHFEPPYSRIVLWVSPEVYGMVCSAWPDWIQVGAHVLRTAGTRWAILGEYFNRGYREASLKHVDYEPYLLGNALCLGALIGRAAKEEPLQGAGPEKKSLLDDIIAYIEAHLADKITLAGTARHFLVSESTIGKAFRSQMDVSFYRYVVQRRLLSAKKLIRDGLPLEEIYSRVGFGDYSAFYRAFKQEYGVSPNQYRALFPVTL